jgi:hypothetical protein
VERGGGSINNKYSIDKARKEKGGGRLTSHLRFTIIFYRWINRLIGLGRNEEGNT